MLRWRKYASACSQDSLGSFDLYASSEMACPGPGAKKGSKQTCEMASSASTSTRGTCEPWELFWGKVCSHEESSTLLTVWSVLPSKMSPHQALMAALPSSPDTILACVRLTLRPLER